MDGKPRRRLSLPLIAAALAGQAVIAAGLVALIMLMNSPGSPGPASPRPAGPAPASTLQLPPETVPPYYAALTSAPGGKLRPGVVTIRDTMSGKVLATVRPPAPYPAFSMVAATGSATAWIVAAGRPGPAEGLGLASGSSDAGQTRLYLLTFNPVTRTTRTGALPGPAMGGIWGAALSPDGRQLAVAVQLSPGVHQIRVYALARAMTAGGAQPGGRLRATWTASGAPAPFAFGEQPLNPLILSWSADNRTLAFNWQGQGPVGPAAAGGLRLLDAGGTGGSLIAASRVVLRDPAPGFACIGGRVLTSDGRGVLCSGVSNGFNQGAGVPGIAWFSAATGQLVRLLVPPSAPPGAALLWASPAGSIVVAGEWQAGRMVAMSVIGPGYTQVLPFTPGTGQAAW